MGGPLIVSTEHQAGEVDGRSGRAQRLTQCPMDLNVLELEPQVHRYMSTSFTLHYLLLT